MSVFIPCFLCPVKGISLKRFTCSTAQKMTECRHIFPFTTSFLYLSIFPFVHHESGINMKPGKELVFNLIPKRLDRSNFKPGLIFTVHCLSLHSFSEALPTCQPTLQGKYHLCIPFLGIARPQSQFPHSCVCERFIYSQDQSTYFPAAE
jgi:hypothetical protein